MLGAIAGGAAGVSCIALVGLGKPNNAMAVGGALLGLCLGACCAAHIHADTDASVGALLSRSVIEFESDCADGKFGSSAIVRVELSGGRSLRALALFPKGTSYLCGEHALASGSVEALSDSGRASYWNQGINCRIKVKANESFERNTPLQPIRRIRAEAIRSLSGESGECALLQAIICGYRPAMQQDAAYGDFQTCGLAHLVAVSGAHLVIVTGFAMSLLQLLKVPKRASIALLIALMVAYTIIAGAPVSCIRAAIMSSVGVLSLLGRRRPSSLNALGVGLVVIIAQAPYASVSASLVLSALSTAGIVLFCPLFERMLERATGGRIQTLCASIAMTAAACLASQLYACSLFSLLPIVSPVANVVCAPLFTLCCGLGLTASLSAVVGAPFAQLLMAAAEGAARLLILVVNVLASIPYSSIPFSIDTVAGLVASFLAALLVWVFWDKLVCVKPHVMLTALCIAFAGAFIVGTPAQSECLFMLDVGQGDAFLLMSKGQTLLIDTGNQDRDLLSQLAKARVSHLDAVLLTHADDDHMGSLDALRKGVLVDLAIVAEGVEASSDASCRRLYEEASRTARSIRYVSAGDEFAVGAFTCEVLWPHLLADNAGNADSIMLDVSYDADGDTLPETRMLFTGDAEIDQLESVITEKGVGRINILKVGHHGSKNAMTEQQLEFLDPSIALIGVGEGNRYGHPTKKIIDMLESRGCKILRTDKDGGVQLELRGPKVIMRPL